MLREQVLDKITVARRYQRARVFLHMAGNIVILLRKQHIHAIGPAIDVIFDPFQFHRQLLRRGGIRTKHAHTARLGGRHNHIAAMRKRDDRHINAKHFAQFCFHI